MNKKILAVLMALMMVLTSAVAFANSIVPVVKNYTGANEAATFTFKAENISKPAGVENAPAIGNIEIEVAADAASATKNFTVDSSLFTVPGTYEYTLSEVIPTTKIAGVTYAENTYTLKVQAYYDADGKMATNVAIRAENANEKSENAAFTNTYTADETGLTVKKVLAGSFADTRDTFTITVTFTTEDENLVLQSLATITKSDDNIIVTNEDDVYTISGIGHNDTVTFTNLPAGIKWTVSETNKVGTASQKPYTDSYDKAEGVIGRDGASTVTNTLDETIDTGVSTDSMPYIMLMAFVMILAAAVVLKKRTVNE